MWQFLRAFWHKELRVAGVCIAVLCLLYPGQNDFQQLVLHPQPLTTRAVEVAIPSLGPVPIRKAHAKIPSLVAQGAIVVDRDSGAVLFAKNPDLQLLPASTTKIMTALVALDSFKLDDQVIITDAVGSIGHLAELKEGETLTVHDLLKAMLIPSGNDAALALGEHDPEGYGHFVELMNAKAKAFHLSNTLYQNVSGIESYRHYSSARDLALLAKEAMKNAAFAQIVGTKETVIHSVDGTVAHDLVNLNELLGVVPGVIGVKTGWTERAGECLVTYTVRDGHTVIVAVLNSNDRFGESAQLIEWAFAAHEWKTL